MFADSIFNNVTLYNPKELCDVEKATSEIGIEEFIKQLPNGFKHIVMKEDNSFFRTKTTYIFFKGLYYKPKILILDEATSSIDSFTEEPYKLQLIELLKIKPLS